MLNSENILLLVCGLGILQGILLAVLIYFHPKADRSVNTFLALFVFFLSVVMMLPFILKIFTWQKSFFHVPTPLLTGPLLYLYLRSFKEVITWRKAWPHFILFIIWYFPVYWNISYYAKLYPDAPIVPPEALHDPATMLLNYLKFGQSIVYYFLARRTLMSYRRSIQHLFSETSHIDLDWAGVLINGFMLTVSSAVVLFSLILRFPEHFTLLLLTNMAISTLYMYVVTYKGIMQATIWQLQPGVNKEAVEEELQEAEELERSNDSDGKPKYQRTGLSEDRINEILVRITEGMEVQKLYLEAELTLQQLAGKLNFQPHQVSQAINEGLKKNFYDLTNGYRVEEAKRLLLDPKTKNLTILSVGLDAGFNSKTTFNTVFKKFTGYTPTEFRESQKVLVEA